MFDEHAAGDDLAALDALPDPQPGLTEADLQGCRFVAGEPTPLRRGMFCCAKTLPGESWCARHRRIVWQRPARRAVASARSGSTATGCSGMDEVRVA
jgi:hypothetical protein